MKLIVTTLIGLAVAGFATTASAHVVEVTTSIPVVQGSDDSELKAAVASAIDDAVHQAIRFTPTVVTLQNVRRVGDRIYLVLLVADQEGEEMIKQLESDGANSSGGANDSGELSTEPGDSAVKNL